MINSMTGRLTLAFVLMRFDEFCFSTRRVATLYFLCNYASNMSLRFTHNFFRCGYTVALKAYIPENTLHSVTPSSTYHRYTHGILKVTAQAWFLNIKKKMVVFETHAYFQSVTRSSRSPQQRRARIQVLRGGAPLYTSPQPFVEVVTSSFRNEWVSSSRWASSRGMTRPHLRASVTPLSDRSAWQTLMGAHFGGA